MLHQTHYGKGFYNRTSDFEAYRNNYDNIIFERKNMDKSYKVLGTRVLLTKVEDNISEGGIIIATSKEQGLQVAEVIGLGDGLTQDNKQHTFRCKIGDKVMYMAGYAIKLTSNTLAINETDIIAKRI